MPSTRQSSTPRADDGTILEVKEAIVQDANGNTLVEPEAAARGKTGGPRVFVFQSNHWLLPLAAAIALPLFIFFGVAILGAFLVALLLTFLVRTLLRALFPR